MSYKYQTHLPTIILEHSNRTVMQRVFFILAVGPVCVKGRRGSAPNQAVDELTGGNWTTAVHPVTAAPGGVHEPRPRGTVLFPCSPMNT